MSNLRDHAVRELEASGWAGPDGFYGDLMEKSVLDVVDLFEKQGHSGMSASVAVTLLERILRFEPLAPLTGDDDEWVILDYDDHLYAQNKRCSHVFKRKDGTAFDAEARVFEDPDGIRYTSRESAVDITFPYTPSREIVKRDD